MSPHDRLTTVTGLIEDAGGRVLSAQPLAHPDTPHEVTAHQVRATSPNPQVHAAVRAVLDDHHVRTRHLVPWAPEEEEEVQG